MVVGRIIGWFLIVLAIAALGHEVIFSLESGTYRVIVFGEQWYKIDKGSLNLLQAVIQRYIWVWLWDGIIANILMLPMWIVFALPGGLLAWFCRRRSDRRSRGLRS